VATGRTAPRTRGRNPAPWPLSLNPQASSAIKAILGVAEEELETSKKTFIGAIIASAAKPSIPAKRLTRRRFMDCFVACGSSQ
jgi:hypothetical protein